VDAEEGEKYCMRVLLQSFAAAVLYCIFLLLLPQDVFSQEFSSIGSDLDQLENLINDTVMNIQEQQKQLEDLKKNLEKSGSLIERYEIIIAERESLLKDLRIRLSEMSEIYRTQSVLSVKYEKSSRFWRNFTLIAVPAAALLSGGLVYAAGR
jgi:septal ring factor EnvC (AmiA/AmiB activator)